MKSFQPLTNQRSAAFTRLASRVLEALNDAVDHRRAEGQTLSAIAVKLDRDRSALSRILNGTSANMTLRTISDILWATNYDPRDFVADPIEKIAPNWIPDLTTELDTAANKVYVLPTQTLRMPLDELSPTYVESAFRKPEFEIATR